MLAEPGSPLFIVGQRGITNVGESFERAALAMGLRTFFLDIADANRAPRWLRALSWRLRERLPPRAGAFEAQVVDAVRAQRPGLVLVTGIAPLRRKALNAIRETGAILANFLTDDPWNPNLRSRWFHQALPRYHAVYSPRRANLAQIEGLGVPIVRYLPFGYDPALLRERQPDRASASDPKVLFVGGADRDRADFFGAFIRAGGHPLLVGAYWERYAETRAYSEGGKPPAEVVWLTRRAHCNLILVRRANRDEHVMRSLEAAAAGGALVVEDTEDHRRLFGADGDCVHYFDTPERAAALCATLVADAVGRQRMQQAVMHRITCGHHSYEDRLREILESLRGTLPAAGVTSKAMEDSAC
jgi:hypothetical protein